MGLIKINHEKLDEKARQERIEELRKLIADSDYKVLPDYDKPNAEIKKQRQAWRDEIRKLGA